MSHKWRERKYHFWKCEGVIELTYEMRKEKGLWYGVGWVGEGNGKVINAKGTEGYTSFTGKAEKMDVRGERERERVYHFVINYFMIESPKYIWCQSKNKILNFFKSL